MKALTLLVSICVLTGMNVLMVHAGVDPDLTIYFPMDEDQGDIVEDRSPNGFQGTITGGDCKSAWDVSRYMGIYQTSVGAMDVVEIRKRHRHLVFVSGIIKERALSCPMSVFKWSLASLPPDGKMRCQRAMVE